MAAKRGAWKPPPDRKTQPRTARLVDAQHLLRGDEIRLSTKGIVGRVTAVKVDDQGRRVIDTDVLGQRVLRPDHQVLRLDPKAPTQADQRKPR